MFNIFTKNMQEQLSQKRKVPTQEQQQSLLTCLNVDYEQLIPFECKESALLASVLRRTRMLRIRKDTTEFLLDLLYKMLTRVFPSNNNKHIIVMFVSFYQIDCMTKIMRQDMCYLFCNWMFLKEYFGTNGVRYCRNKSQKPNRRDDFTCSMKSGHRV